MAVNSWGGFPVAAAQISGSMERPRMDSLLLRHIADMRPREVLVHRGPCLCLHVVDGLADARPQLAEALNLALGGVVCLALGQQYNQALVQGTDRGTMLRW